MTADDGTTSPAVKWLRWGGYALLLAALVYCALALWDLGTDAVVERFSLTLWSQIAVAAIAYGAALALLAAGWLTIAVKGATGGAAERGPARMLAIYGPAVIAKYIPGSVFQYGSRQLNGARYGLSQGAMLRASVMEAAIHVPMALLCAAVLISGGGWIGLVLLVGGGGAIVRFVEAPTLRAGGYQMAFFACFALVILMLADVGIAANDPGRLAAIFMVAWAAGFVVPIAPGGIGVRETALIAMASPSEDMAIIATFALVTRLVTTMGDGLMGFAGYSLLVSRRSNRQASA